MYLITGGHHKIQFYFWGAGRRTPRYRKGADPIAFSAYTGGGLPVGPAPAGLAAARQVDGGRGVVYAGRAAACLLASAAPLSRAPGALMKNREITHQRARRQTRKPLVYQC